MADSTSPPSILALPSRPRESTPDEMAAGLSAARDAGLLSPDFKIELHNDSQPNPSLTPPRSAPANMQHFQSPMRHHRRTPSAHREVKETLNARSEYANDDSDGRFHHRINQYIIKEEIGRGSFGAVHIATDQFGNEYAIKEFSKARLRKRAQSSLLRQGPSRFTRFPPRAGFGAPDSPHARMSSHKAEEAKDALFLIREEIAIMKKLNHPNLVQLIEVLDDPLEDSLYMVLEMCKKGVVMKVGLHESAQPYSEEQCRCWFRDLILGIEYLHSQGVVHRDIKPDNLLLTEDDVLKVSDFGVSEMFERPDEMRTAKSAGSPAFLPPELCMAKHGDISGKAADLWSMGVSLYCLRYGKIPFQRDGVLDMYEAIKNETPSLPPDENPQFVDVISRLMEKDPEKRITMAELREHPWVTKGGQDPLLSTEENCMDPVDLPNSLEVNHAFTRRMSHLLCVMKAISKFKSLLGRRGTGTSQHHGEDDADATPRASPTATENRASEDSTANHIAEILKQREQFRKATGGRKGGMALDVINSEKYREPNERSDTLHLGIGTGGMDDFGTRTAQSDTVSESPTAVDFNIYDLAFRDEVDRIKRSSSRKRGSRNGTVFLTKLNEQSQQSLQSLGGGGSESDATPRSSASTLASQARGGRFADLVTKAMMEAKQAQS
ncbi:kinase-like domain-containing protein [Echria macrotheca]|uniref:Kinase-like domain-containing protein n=1 Tax=Echria macrotheca TaxID=438768 RepID=A0AAJ0BHS6_9PEZI|nr:kinase-like domain-containing protein [Echria macrotheca]